MSITLLDLASARRTINVKWFGMEFDVTYNPTWLTPENEDDLQAILNNKVKHLKDKVKQARENPETVDEEEEAPELNLMRDSLIHTLIHSIIDWDIYMDKEKKQKLAVSEDGIRKLPYPMQTAILRAMSRDAMADVGEVPSAQPLTT